MIEKNEIVSIAVDTLGSETSLYNIIKGLNISFLRNENYHFNLFGKKTDITNELKKYKALADNVKIFDCIESVEMTDKPSEVMKSKKDSSMFRSIDSVKIGKSDAVLSCGNTGVLMALALFNLKTLTSIKRPAIASIWPNIKSESIVLDLGANIKSDYQYLIDNAILGASLASILLKIKDPSVGLLNVGKEDTKGNEILQKASSDLIELDKKGHLNYFGFVEGSDISLGITNVVVTDGFTGNIALKTAEGTARMIQNFLKSALSSSFFSKIGSFFASLALKSLKDKLDPRIHNCGIFVGLNAPVIKCHGASDYVGIAYAADLMYLLISSNVNEKIRENLEKY
ncbi:MAG: phosphate acyltransferase PlsX [Candidatus Pelagibacterales bacterium]|jgi:glycerol-3-phosphate acyltransferase PlsX|tara:strand:+ start:26121 stop:27146 length:1026 start_codon:yes stop_codon:yes gene_type:complete